MRERRAKPLTFFVLVFALSLPFWLAGHATGMQLLPGLPLAALGAFCPAVAALILCARDAGSRGAFELLTRTFDAARIPSVLWYVPTIALMPAALLAPYAVMAPPDASAHIPLLTGVAMFIAFFAAGLGEELGWSGFALEPLQRELAPLGAALLIGLIWALWHFVPLVQAHRELDWIAWWGAGTIATRVIMVWLYNGAGRSILATAIFHAMSNVGYFFLLPNVGASYASDIGAATLIVVACMVTLVWLPQMVSRTSPLSMFFGHSGCDASGPS
jgi:membrane protease YdiL (CAAX protease family)